MPVAAIYIVATGFLSVNVHRGTSHGGLNETVLRRSLAGHVRRFNKPSRNKIGDQMKKNRHKKYTSLPVLRKPKDNRAAKIRTAFFGFKDLTSERVEVRDSALQLLREADVILATNKGIPPFYGKERLKEVAAGKIDETSEMKMLVIGLDDEEIDQQAEELRKIVLELKGSCCHGVAEPCLCVFIGKDGQIQHWDQDGKNGIVVAATHQMAKKFAAWMKKHKEQPVSIAELGSVQSETSEKQFDGSVKMGANSVWCIQSIEGNSVVCEILKPLPKSWSATPPADMKP